MNAARAATVLGYLRRLGRTEEARASSDANLLERYAARREAAAFAELVKRHGPMVLGVCRRILANVDDAEDAFQATFLVMAARPRAVGKPASLANWLFGVARRTALRVQVDAARRYRHEQLSAKAEAISPETETLWRDLRPVLDAEVARLPESCREVFILCCLEGRTHEEAGRLLGCPPGTIASRLSRARERLRNRLVRRGLTLGAAAALFAAGEAEAAVSSQLIGVLLGAAASRTATVLSTAGSISPRVAALTEGVLRAMWTTKLKVAAALFLAVSAAGFGAGLVISTAAQPGPGPSVGQPVAPAGDFGDKGGRREIVGPVDPKPPAPPARPPEEEEKKGQDAKPQDALSAAAILQDAEDEYEVMTARLNAKRADLEAAKAEAAHAKVELNLALELRKKNSISQEEVEHYRSVAESTMAQVRIKEADIREPEIRVRQARRRLVALREALGTDEATGRPPAPRKDPDAPEREKKEKGAEPSVPLVLAATIQDAEEEVELMKARLDAKRAELDAAKATAEPAKNDLKRATELMTKAAISREEFEKTRAAADAALAQVRIKEADIVEPEIRLRQATRRLDRLRALKGTPVAKPVETKDLSPQAADSHDSIELMAAQLDVQRARSAAARQDLETAKATLANLKKAGRVVTETENAQAEADVRAKEAQVRIRDAELAEAEVRLKQAKRRWDENTRPSSPTKDAERIEELEKKIDRLNKELEALKKRLKAEGKP
jgi:RNA polymerase sigma factor (sigma-70 family)